MSDRLKKGETTINQVLRLSHSLYRSEIDNKRLRMKIDVRGCKVVARRGLTYNKATKEWEQTARELRIDFIVRSEPESYIKTDTVAVHKYPVTFLIKDYSLKLNSPFRWRTGGLKKWKNHKPATRHIYEAKNEAEKDKIRKEKELLKKENLKITNLNIQNGLQGNFIFNLMWVLKQYGLLFGPLTCKNLPPKITNPTHTPYFDKTALYVAIRILPRILMNPKVNQMFAKPSRMA